MGVHERMCATRLQQAEALVEKRLFISISKNTI